MPHPRHIEGGIVLTEPAGPGAAVEGARMLLDAFPDLTATILASVLDADMVVVRFVWKGQIQGATGTWGNPLAAAPLGRP